MKTIIKILTVLLIVNYTFTAISQCVQCDNNSSAQGVYSSVLGMSNTTTANSDGAFAGGYGSTADGAFAFAFGNQVTANGANSLAIGRFIGTNTSAMIFGTGADLTHKLINYTSGSLMIGFNSSKPTFFVKGATGDGYTGKIGIGDVTDLQAKLHIKADNSENADLLLEPTGSGKYARIEFGSLNNRIDATMTGDLNFRTASDFVFWDANVGIGTYNPATKLDVAGTVKSTGLKLIDGNQSAGKILQSDADGNASWVSATSIDDGDWIVKSFGNDIYRLNGSVGIGTDLSQNPNNYKLAVNGIIGTKEVYVENSSITWSDYVFLDDYNLLSLREVEEYIKTNGHLPEVPTAEEVNINGLKLAEMNALLLKKIEELTLYIIDLQKESQVLKEGFEEIKCEISKNQ